MPKRLLLSERIMLAVVAINSLLIYAMCFPGLKDVRWLEYIDVAFICVFIIEALVKIRALRRSGYFGNPWNRFDFMVVVVSLPSLVAPFTGIPDTGFFIILRLFRVVRIIRLLRFVPNMQHVMLGLGRALKASVFVLATLLFLVFFFSIVTCHLYGEIIPEYFGDPLISLFSVFQLFTIEGWYEIPDAIEKHTESEWLVGLSRFYFGMIVLLGGVFGMSLANAVFVDEMTMDNTDVLEAKVDELQLQVAELKEMLQQRQ